MEKKFLFNQTGNSYLKIVFIFAGLILVIFAVFFIIQFAQKQKRIDNLKENKTPIAATSTADEKKFNLPSSVEIGIISATSTGQSGETAEKYYPGDFYKAPEAPVDFAAKYSLPLNIKTETINYYDFSRKINLDSVLEDLNTYGFAVIKNPFPDVANFYETYNVLNKEQIPPLITADFLTYYYQNIVKLTYKKIEGAVFYDTLWQTNKKLYETAKLRYEKQMAESGIVNSVPSEGARMELVFLAVSLSLLQPNKNQIDSAAAIDGGEKFSTNEAEKYSFFLPDYLQDNVFSEIALIREARDRAKSPALLYERNYSDFIIPAEYRTSERLKNFYLASRWLNSVWPLYYRDENCPTCLLDKDDWRISFYASMLLSDDLAGSQDLKNRWAQVYKIKSFFTGLRSDLNYLHYRAALDKTMGADKRVIDSLPGENLEANLFSLSEEISKIEFPLVEGGRDKKSLSEKPYIGLKMLAEEQWPSAYIFNRLTATSTGSYLGDYGSVKKIEKIDTICIVGRKTSRCTPSAFDIINLVTANGYSDSYIASNTAYEFYADRMDYLQKELMNFTPISWHNSNFWLTLDIVKKNFFAPALSRSTFAESQKYRQRDYIWALSSWVNFQLPPDEFILSERSQSRLNSGIQENKFISYAYIEPNQILIKELLANTDMMTDYLTALKINDQAGAALYDLKNLRKTLAEVEEIIKKEMAGDHLTEEDYKKISNLYGDFFVKKAGEKNLLISGIGPQKMQESLSGVKILLVVYQRGDKKAIAAGPIFDYKEIRIGKKW